MRVLVVGFGVTGRAMAGALVAAGDDVLVWDDKVTDAGLVAAREIGVPLEPTPPGSSLGEWMSGADLVVPSPGVPIAHPVYAAASDLGIPVRSEIEMAYQVGERRPQPPAVVAITGTNGKTTVTTMATAILRSSGVDAVAAGNIGLPMIEAVQSEAEVVVAEVSSFQLQFTDRFHPVVSCWLNLAPDHLDWHPTNAHYAAAKARIWANQGEGDTAVVNLDDPAVVAAAESSVPPGVKLTGFSVRDPADFSVRNGRLVGPGGTFLVEVAELPRALPHDLANSLAAAAVAVAAGATEVGCQSGLVSTPPLPHRVSLVAAADGVAWYDDSKATTPASVQAAVAGFSSVILIAGGRNKGLDLASLAATVPPVRAVVAIGEAAGEVRTAFDGLVPVTTAGTMEEAVWAAGQAANAGDAVLLSPGCASFDWYSSYGQRGDHFAEIVKTTLVKGGSRC